MNPLRIISKIIGKNKVADKNLWRPLTLMNTIDFFPIIFV